MTDGIEITVTRLPGASGRHRGGHGIYVATAASPPQPAWARRRFIAGDGHEDLWRLVAKAAAWAANEAEKRA